MLTPKKIYDKLIPTNPIGKVGYMKFSTKSKYGIKALVDLAGCSRDELVSIKIIAERQKIPDSYLEQLFSTLRKAGIITSVKGPYGGYKLSDSPQNISVAQIIRALDGELSVLTDKDKVTFQEDPLSYCINTNLWEQLDQHVTDYLNNITLEDIKKQYTKMISSESYMFYI